MTIRYRTLRVLKSMKKQNMILEASHLQGFRNFHTIKEKKSDYGFRRDDFHSWSRSLNPYRTTQ